MGWWTNDKLAGELNDPELVWGDEVADIMHDAIMKISEIYQRDWGRGVRYKEVQGGVTFDWAGLYDADR